MRIFCVECDEHVQAKLVTGAMVYSDLPKVARDKFWMCNSCKNFVGCHKNANKNKQKPLGVIANKELRQMRMNIHNVLDQIWREEKRMKRTELYAILSKELGYEYHTGDIVSIGQGERVLEIVDFIDENYK